MRKNKNLKRSLFILTEGKTEEAYFSRIKEILGDDEEWKYSVFVEVREIIDGSKQDPLGLVKEAKRSIKDYSEVWVVFDKDRERDHENLLALELAYKTNIKVAFSSISFEEWVLLHFERNSTAFERSDCESRGQLCTCAGDRCISTYIKRNYYPAYKKGRANLYLDLQDKLIIALENSAWLKYYHYPINSFHLLNPYTNVDNLVSQLLELPIFSFSRLNFPFVFEEIVFCVAKYSEKDTIVKVILQTTNNSNKTFLFNNTQQNIKLVDTNNNELTYTISQAQIVNPGQEKSIEIQFIINAQFIASKLKFHAIKECVFVELLNA